MKIRITMKDPDAVSDAAHEAVKRQVDELPLSQPEKDAVLEIRREKVEDKVGEWFRYGELLTVEIDTDAGTCTVVKP